MTVWGCSGKKRSSFAGKAGLGSEFRGLTCDGKSEGMEKLEFSADPSL